MKNLKELIYWIMFIIYEEILFSTLVFRDISTNALWIILLSMPFAIGLNIITSLFPKKVNIVISYISTFGVCFIVGAQLMEDKLQNL